MSTETVTDRIHIRWAVRRDMPAVQRIDSQSFKEPWGEEDFSRALRLRNHIGMVAEFGEQIIGYVIYSLGKSSLDVLRLAVPPLLRRRGIGGRILQKLIDKLSSHRRNRITLSIPESDLNALNFLKRLKPKGFKAVRVDRGDPEDAIVMELALPRAPDRNRIAELLEKGCPEDDENGSLSPT